MTIAEDSYWPESGPDQGVFLANLQRRVDNLRHAVKPIVVPKFNEPVQSDWEQAWSLLTGLFPPIPPGVKLLWYDLSAGEMRQYTVTYNLSNGTDSDGTVYPIRPDTANASYFRFLGSLGRRGTMLSAFAKPDNTVTTLMINPEIWMQRGLRRLIIEFSLDVTTASMILHCGVPETGAAGDYQIFDYAAARYDITSLTATRGTGTTLSTTLGGGGVDAEGGALTETFTVSPAGYPFIGRIHIDFGRDNTDEKQYFGPIVSLLGFSFGAATGSSDIEMHYGALTRNIAVNSLRNQIYLKSGDFPVNGKLRDRAWIYGIFDTAQESELGEY